MTASSGLFLTSSQWLKLGQTEARSWEFNVNLLHGRQGLNCLNHQHLLSPRMHWSRKLDLGVESGTRANVECGHLKWFLHCSAKSPCWGFGVSEHPYLQQKQNEWLHLPIYAFSFINVCDVLSNLRTLEFFHSSKNSCKFPVAYPNWISSFFSETLNFRESKREMLEYIFPGEQNYKIDLYKTRTLFWSTIHYCVFFFFFPQPGSGH